MVPYKRTIWTSRGCKTARLPCLENGRGGEIGTLLPTFAESPVNAVEPGFPETDKPGKRASHGLISTRSPGLARANFSEWLAALRALHNNATAHSGWGYRASHCNLMRDPLAAQVHGAH